MVTQIKQINPSISQYISQYIFLIWYYEKLLLTRKCKIQVKITKQELDIFKKTRHRTKVIFERVKYILKPILLQLKFLHARYIQGKFWRQTFDLSKESV